MILNCLTTGERLFEEVHVRTSSVDSGGDRVDVGGFDGDGLDVDDWDGSGQLSYIGVASARKS